jgi:oligopeptide/dipeptide ABC transporter ATP-binding protein
MMTAAAGERRVPTRDTHPLVEVQDLAVHFPIFGGPFGRRRGLVYAVDGVSLQIRAGETVGLVGESGSGKTTLGMAIMRLVEPTAGRINFDGQPVTALRGGDLRRLRRRMQIVLQDPYSSLDPHLRVEAIIGEALDIHHLARGAQRAERVRELLGLVGLDPRYASRHPHAFSGGQRQRIGIARALAVEPEFIVCDEPISALDVSIQAQILNLLLRLRRELGLTYLFIAHDLSVVRHISDRVGVMYLGKLIELGPPGAIFARSGNPYTRALLSAVPIADPRAERRRRRVILQGDIPSPANPPTGCRFHTRCWLYERLGAPDRCRDEEPQLQAIGEDHQTACHFQAEALGSDIGVVETPHPGAGSVRSPQRGGTIERGGAAGRI